MNKHLLHDLTEMGVWSPALKNKIIYENGSVQNIPEIPVDLRAIYKYDEFPCISPVLSLDVDLSFLPVLNILNSELFGRSSKRH